MKVTKSRNGPKSEKKRRERRSARERSLARSLANIEEMERWPNLMLKRSLGPGQPLDHWLRLALVLSRNERAELGQEKIINELNGALGSTAGLLDLDGRSWIVGHAGSNHDGCGSYGNGRTAEHDLLLQSIFCYLLCQLNRGSWQPKYAAESCL